MPDLQTELSKVLSTWDTPEEKQVESHTTQTVHIGKRVFDLVQAHPNLKMAEYEKLSSSIGVSEASVKNYIMLFNQRSWGLVRCDGERYTVCSDTYKTKNEMMGLPKGLRVSQAKRRRLIKSRTEGISTTKTPQVGKGVLQDLLMGQVNIRPGIPRGTLVAFAVKHGMKEDSAKVTIRSLIKDGRIVEKDDAGLYLPGVSMVDPHEVMQDMDREELRKANELLAKEAATVAHLRTIVEQVESLTIREARALYEQLQKYFSF